MADADESPPGPVDFVMIEFPHDAPAAGTVQALSALVDAGTIRLFDIALVAKGADGSVQRVDLGNSDHAVAGSLGAFVGAEAGLFDSDDLDQASAALDPDTVGVLIAYENAWAQPFVAAAHAAGGQLVASERIPAQVLIDALDAVEPVG